MTSPADPGDQADPPARTAALDTRTSTGVMTVWVRRALFLLLGLVVAVVFLVVVSTFLPAPVNVVGATLSSFSAHLAISSLLLVAAVGWLWWRRRTWARGALVLLAVLSLAGVTVIGGRQLAMADREKADLDVGALLELSHGSASPDENVDYLRFEGQALSLSVWRQADGDGAGAPVIVMVHGGGFISSSRLEGTPPAHARWFAEHGYLVISADYTLSTDQRHLWDVTEQQIGCALAWTGANARRYGGDTTRLMLVGDSAGGNLALRAAYKGNAGQLRSSCGGTPPRVAAVSALYPVSDMAQLYANEPSRIFAERYVGGSPDQYPERYAATTPANHITPQAPPTLLTMGTSDYIVPPDGTRRLYDRLHRGDVPCDLVEVPYGQHVFDAAPGAVGTQVWRQATLRWFADHAPAGSPPAPRGPGTGAAAYGLTPAVSVG
ncbi:acetyl esterase/lipase [Saccharothrix carnea]|uniref:Acetyl esterase/lipase n=1 Tax=Saccharothrix carnea TaxID=1280637 RepID=A0A2P8I1I3_SACCR|nr:alpha/beta hydrolase [Saccharothrix carnea]PSL52326.1 acetyl esterase/lipase [Saccharothrix carnea]